MELTSFHLVLRETASLLVCSDTYSASLGLKMRYGAAL
jgi:hypothetical protein